MSIRALDKDTATEHLRDGQDSIKECVKTLQRVQKSYPTLADDIGALIGKLTNVRTDIDDVAQRLKRS
jgi:peptidoglycan hydrolase CwlO-like protein